MATGGQLEVPRHKLVTADLLDEISDEDKEETKKALYEYVFWRAEGDQLLSRDETESFREAHQKSKDGCEEGHETTNAQEVGRRLAELGDQIDAMYTDEFEDIVKYYDDPQQAFTSFSSVVRTVFEWDDNGLPKINIGRVAVVLGYCYHLCKNYINQYLNSYGLLGFLGMISGFLIKFFIQAKFYEWLNKQGGWSQLFQISAGGWLNRISWSPNVFLIIGLASLAIYVIQYIRGR